MTKNIFIITIFLFLTSCVNTIPTDLVISNVEKTDVSAFEYDEIHNLNILGVSSPYKKWNNKQGKIFKEWRLKEPLYRISFQSEIDLQEYIKSTEQTISSSGYICAKPDTNLMLTLVRVYWRGLEIGHEFNHKLIKEADNMYEYYFYISSSVSENTSGTVKGFDIINDPKDLCFEIKGGRTIFGFKSNILEVSAEEFKNLQ